MHPMVRTLFRMTSLTDSFGGAFLGLRLPETGGGADAATVDHLDSSSIAVSLPWPAWLAREDGQICLAAALALADETSTFAMGSWDKQIRPGVSVSLNGQRATAVGAAATITPGERITFASRLMKGGSTLAWVHLEARRGNGELLVSGRHLKFQPSGLPPGWSLVSHPRVRPFTYQAVELLHQAGYTPFFERFSHDATPLPLPAEGTPRLAALSMTEDVEGAPPPASTSFPLFSDASAPRSFTASLTRQHGNPGATLHGGCAALLLDAAASASYCANRACAAPPAVQRMHINLLGAIRVPRAGATKSRPVRVSAAVSAADPRAHAVLCASPSSSGRGKGKAGWEKTPEVEGATPAVEAGVWW